MKGDPASANVERGLQVYREGKHDGVVSFGGGSALDAGKAIASISGQTRPLWDFEDVGNSWLRTGLPSARRRRQPRGALAHAGRREHGRYRVPEGLGAV